MDQREVKIFIKSELTGGKVIYSLLQLAFNVGLFSLVEHYPYFETRLRAALNSIVGTAAEQRVEIGMAKDGSGVGGKTLSVITCSKKSLSSP